MKAPLDQLLSRDQFRMRLRELLAERARKSKAGADRAIWEALATTVVLDNRFDLLCDLLGVYGPEGEP